ncbi:Fe(3+) dicitrate transport protein [Cnuella takakiae]|uniref:Fe(3+) dicitrate transport protein n=2 Tax=Cnuella takakiae TaxID=1302690 RepID=A0A1M4SQ23_9BACT|nr:Fe(3+) dicitrate transport protein [Cnuella takakiae]
MDTSSSKNLKEIKIKAWMRKDINRLPDEDESFVTAGKKNEVISIANTNANISIKTGRQLFAKVPGVFVYDMDGSGNQINISTRGLDAHRSWEFNNRQNNVIINSDMYGYPASHYSAPMESIEKIELVRGTGSLQYGAQFGGMINYITKKPDSTKVLSFESVNTVGSFALMSTYNAISGTSKKFSYTAYYYRRHSSGYRENSPSDANAQFIQLQYKLSDRLVLKGELGRSKYLYQIPGPLNDSMFQQNPRLSTRNRNFFSPDIYVPSLSLNWQPTKKTKVYATLSGVFGNRSSVQLDAFANIPDNMDPVTGTYKNRQVDIDHFNSKTFEAKLLHSFYLGKLESRLVAGIMYMNNDLHRQQLGKGTTATNYDLSLVEPNFGRDIHFGTGNIALFAEHKFQLNKYWSVAPGVRYEHGKSEMVGKIKYYPTDELPTTIKHDFLLTGMNTQYQLSTDNQIYAGFSQAYRPVIFKDIVPASTYERIDKSLKDAFGYNLEVGLRGKLLKYLQFDLTYFRLSYQNRLGTLVLQDPTGQPYTFKTNVGNSITNGMEIFFQYRFPLTGNLFAGLFTSTTYMDAQYVKGQVSDGRSNKPIAGNKVEAVPNWITRNGLEVLYKGFTCTILHNYTSETFSDVLNTVTPPVTGARGLTPSYSVWDFNSTIRINPMINLRGGLNNIFDKSYFTKRPTFYPGPGIWPSDGRNYYVTVGFKI